MIPTFVQTSLYSAVLTLFSSGANGAFLDANDWGPTGTGGTGVVFQDAAGTLPVTAMEQPVGLVLDKSQGLKLGANVVGDPNFQSPAYWTAGAGWSVTGGAGVATATSVGIAKFGLLTIGKWYKATITVNVTSGSVYLPWDSSGAFDKIISASGTYTRYFLASGTTLYAGYGATPFTGSITNLTVQPIAGNHAYVSASANRPVISARYSLLIKTEDFSDAAWVKFGFTLASSTEIAPDGTATAFKLTENNTDSNPRLYQSITASSDSRKYVAYLKASAPTTINFSTTGGIGNSVSLTTSWQAVSVTQAVSNSVGGLIGGFSSVARGSGISIYVWHPDLRPTDQATGLIPTYQRVNTATDYDTVGFPVREAYNGSNQLLGGASGGGATTGFFFCAGVMITKVGAAQTLFSDTGTNTGWRVRINASNQLELSAGNGTTYTTVATVGTVSINKLTVVTAWHDGTNLNVQINQGAVAQAAFAVATAGTAGYTLGCDNGASTNYLQGSLGEIVYRTGTAMNAAQIAVTQSFVNSKQKAY